MSERLTKAEALRLMDFVRDLHSLHDPGHDVPVLEWQHNRMERCVRWLDAVLPEHWHDDERSIHPF